jgi:RHS repeat-associated protein
VQRQTSVTTRFVYDEAGQLLGQYNNVGQPLQQYVWLGGQPVGVLLPQQEGQPANTRLKYVQSDALGSPRAIIDPTRNLAIWRWDETSEGFGDTAPNTDPDGDSIQTVFDLRFPGQRYDQASGLHYNYFRDYDPATGRYMQSDPIGLDGGLSTYAYAGSDPLSATDPFGLFEITARDVAGFVPVLGSGLDAYDAYKCGHYGMMALNIGLALVDLTGVGAIAKGIAVGTMKFAARKAIRGVYKSTTNWDDMRRGLQKIGQIPVNSRSTPNRDWLTTDHIFRKQRFDLPHEKTNVPWNLQTNITKSLNSRFERMSTLQRAMYLPTWMKLGAAGATSTATGWFVGSGSNSGGECGCN